MELKPGEAFLPESAAIIIDALLGTGLSKPLGGEHKRLVEYINGLYKKIIAVDIPTGFYADGEVKPDATVLKADFTVTFQQPKISFLLPECATATNHWAAVDIGIDAAFTWSLNSPYQFVEEKDIKQMIRPRHRFSNKGTYGHALMVAGQEKTMGAALLCASACAYAGAGLTTACVPQSGLVALNAHMPELMAIVRNGKDLPEIEWGQFNTMGIGPGLGKEDASLALIKDILKNFRKPVVLDADALNLLAKNEGLWDLVPPGSIVTPHMKEFDRLFGNHSSWWQRLQTGVIKAKQHGIHIVLKNDYTITVTPKGMLYFNSTSNQAMATGGMGDVLTGIITSLLAQQYSPEEACILGVYIHGKAGDELALPNRMNVVLPGRLAQELPFTMARLIE
jgi:NAD(P)H-hydrate epimerase